MVVVVVVAEGSSSGNSGKNQKGLEALGHGENLGRPKTLFKGHGREQQHKALLVSKPSPTRHQKRS